MAELDVFKNNLDFPIYGLSYSVVFAITDGDGDLISGATGIQSTISKNGNDMFVSTTNSVTEIANGYYYITLTSTEMSAQAIILHVTSTSTGSKPVSAIISPKTIQPIFIGNFTLSDLMDSFGNTVKLGATDGKFLNYYCNCIIAINSPIEPQQVRYIYYYDNTTKIATLNGAIANPSVGDTYNIYLTENSYNIHAYNNLKYFMDFTGVTANSNIPLSSVFNRIYAANTNKVVYESSTYKVFDNDNRTQLYSYKVYETGRMPQ